MSNTTEHRFWSKVEKTASGCWLWHGARQPSGYGQLWNGERPEQAHRISFRLFVGDIPPGKEIDHRCDNRSCVNPRHLRAVTHRENMRRSQSVVGENARKTFCKRGHALEGANLYVNPGSGSRQCRACLREHARARRAAR